ncbi:glycosyltransferase family 4 protein [Thermophagus sp. OGC60D27]|uniref:glycosyltransferase family 4 protein n=1 Tax=Thermophagus sp. OGC60D27 TaxID=3458415 RepID=UPI004037EA7A
MNVLHINKSDQNGGAALASVRLLNALRENGTEAQMLVLQNQSLHPGISPLAKTRRDLLFQNLKFMAEIAYFTRHEKNRQHRFSFSTACAGTDISGHPMVKKADILHLHWINQGFLSLKDLKKLIATRKPIVWTLHDLWPVTGGCHYPGGCDAFSASCGFCPLLKRPGKKDLSARQFSQKQNIYSDASITFVGCSNWIKKMAEHSSLAKTIQRPIYQIFNPIDISLFSPKKKEKIRQQLGLPLNKKLILFGAANISDPRKGTNLLLKALQNMASIQPDLKQKVELIAFGKNTNDFQHKLNFYLHNIGIVNSQKKMASLYQAADAFVLPSLQDNLPNTVVESLSCGTPVVAFKIGGVPEMIRHKENGFLAASGNWEELSMGILHVLKDNGAMSSNARTFALNHFSPEIIAEKYQTLYQSLSG